MTLVPAYGRDYKSKAEVIADLKAGKDFSVADFQSSGYTNLEDLKKLGVQSVNVRYKRLASVTVVDIRKL
jgi:hypothetical protein